MCTHMDLRVKQPSPLSTIPKSPTISDVLNRIEKNEGVQNGVGTVISAGENPWGYGSCSYKTLLAHPPTCAHLEVGTGMGIAPAVADTQDQISLGSFFGKRSQVAKEVCLEGAIVYSCTICDYRSMWKHNLTRHIKVHANHKPFYCPINGCNYRAICSQRIRKHYRLIHNANLPPKKRLIVQDTFGFTKDCGNKMESNMQTSSMALPCVLCECTGDGNLNVLARPCKHKTVVRCRTVQVYSLGKKSS